MIRRRVSPPRGSRGVAGLVALALLAGCLLPPSATLAEEGSSVAVEPSADPRAVDPFGPVTLSARDLDVKDVLAMLVRSRGLNVVCAPEVSGTITLDLHEVPFHEALSAAVTLAGFEVARRGSIYYVRRSRDGDPAEAVLRDTRTYRLDYADPEDLTTVVLPLLTTGGTVVAYPPLRSLVVEDRPQVLDRVGRVVRALDRAPRQVVIEARILEARLSSDFRFGIDWSVLFDDGDDGEGSVSAGDGFAPDAGQDFFLTWENGDLTASLQAVEGVDELQTLASPRLLVTDGASAKILIGGELGFPVVSTIDNTVIQSVEFLDTGTQLVVTPTVAGDGYVRMEVHPELSDGVVTDGLPSKTTTEVSTDVLVRDGQTLVIGGLIREREETSRRGIPFLMRLPILGGFFGRTVTTVQRTELITLITPRIADGGHVAEWDGEGVYVDPERFAEREVRVPSDATR